MQGGKSPFPTTSYGMNILLNYTVCVKTELDPIKYNKYND